MEKRYHGGPRKHRRSMPLRMLLVIMAVLAALCLWAMQRAEASELTVERDVERNGEKQTVTCTSAFTPGGKLSVTNGNGAVTISPWDKQEIRIVAEKWLRGSHPGSFLRWLFGQASSIPTSDSGKQALLDQIEIRVTGHAGEVKVETHYPNKQVRRASRYVSYTIQLPRASQILAKTSNGAMSVRDIAGEVCVTTLNGQLTMKNIEGPVEGRTSNGGIHIENVHAEVHAQTSNGGITCDDVSGQVEAHTSNGGIHITCAQPLTASDHIRCQTSNGGIEVRLPGASSFNLNASTSNSVVTCDFPILVRADASHNRKHLKGQVGEDRAEVHLSSSNGHIRIAQR